MNHACEVLIGLGAKLSPPVDSAVIDRIAARYGVTIPKEARELYAKANGSAEDFGEWSWHFWSIDCEELTLASYLKRPRDYALSPSGRKIDPRKYVRFFDCLIDAPLYAYCADQNSPHFGEVIGCHTDSGTFDAFVSASSITRFLEMFSATRGDEVILIDEKKEPNQ